VEKNTSKNINGLEHVPEKWKKCSIRENTNCYAYALDLPIDPKTERRFISWEHIQPGNICNRKGKVIFWDSIIRKLDKKGIKYFISEFRKDCKYLGYEVRKSSYKESRRGDWWKVALCFDKEDYHWYRQNDDGTWSHKMGMAEASNKDKKDKVITNPETCNRGSYRKFKGYFLIRENPYGKPMWE